MIQRPSSRALLAVALILPLLVFAYSWLSSYRLAQQGKVWLIPIQGYDPRDLLRGHFIQYQYDWPMAEKQSEIGTFNPFYASTLCIEGNAPDIAAVREPSSTGAALDMSPCAVTVRATASARRESRGLTRGILFTSQARAIALSKQLADPQLQGFLRARIRPDGVIQPLDLTFRPRAIP